ncbi:DNA methyltransferase [Bosea lathyri]|uniref:Methyltransferase n=1 Tax=Bosea lathyri TaxID=1036778 RepID=A0A1H6BFH0_9HYPH|nr:DNA methyltransferase [Bosea lathyri]SEG58996.1 modification methylase [Bosea lathyri]
MSRVEHLSDSVTLYLGDCREILPTLSKVGRLICAPYGQGYKVNTFYAGGTRAKMVVQKGGRSLPVHSSTHAEIKGDDEPFDPSHILGLAPDMLIWGAHRFADRLPQGSWLVWDKVPNGKIKDQGDGEAAWINRDQPMRIYRLLWDGLSVGTGARHEVTAGQKRLHHMQKPVALMAWSIDQLGGTGDVLDPYMGSGSTGVACVQRDIAFIGIEAVPAYFDIACRRIANELKRPRFALGAPAPIVRQEALEL